MQPIINLGHVLCKETAVGTNAVATQRDLSRFRTVYFDEVESLLHGFGFAHCGHLDEFKKTRGGVHLGDEIIHTRKNIVWLKND